MSKRALLLLIAGGLALFVAGLAGSFFVYNNFFLTKSVPKVSVPKITNPIAPAINQPQATFSLSGVPASLSLGKNFDVNINIASSENILAVDLDVSYDPTKISLERVAPGGLFAEPMEFSKSVNNKTGKVFYALGAIKGSSGSGVVAVLKFQALVNERSPMITLGDKTNASAKGGSTLKIILANQ